MYHVAPADYNKGEDVYSMNQLIEMGYEVEYKWAADCPLEDYPDADIVSMTETLEEAEEILALNFSGKGIIIVIDDSILEDAFRNSEGYWSVYDWIEADYITGYNN